MSYEIEIKNLDTIREMFKKAPDVCDKYLEAGTKDAGVILVSNMQQEAPQGETKKLHTNIGYEYKPIQVRVFPRMFYAIFVEKGTKAHTILPKNVGYRGHSGGLWINKYGIVRNRVQHPGTKPNPFVQRTAENSQGNINLIFREVLNKIINNI